MKVKKLQVLLVVQVRMDIPMELQNKNVLLLSFDEIKMKEFPGVSLIESVLNQKERRRTHVQKNTEKMRKNDNKPSVPNLK